MDGNGLGRLFASVPYFVAAVAFLAGAALVAILVLLIKWIF